jgi:predicted RNase H-like HicB family nuclease
MDQPNPNPFGHFYAQGVPVPPGTLPGTITVTNTGDVPPTSVTRQVVDEVTIGGATYVPNHSAGGTLTVLASSSDKGDSAAIPAPTLVLDGFPNAVATGTDPVTFVVAPTATVPGLAVPPLSVTVTSSAGGQGRADVAIATPAAGAFAAGHPFAQNDVVTVAAGSGATPIPVLANDSSNPAGTLAPATVAIAVAPTSGTALANADGTITYTPPTVAAVVTFTYTVRDALGNISNAATVTVDVTAPVGGPIPSANSDSFTVVAGSTTTLTVLGNDSGNGGTLDPASVRISTAPASGTATPNADGTITFIAGAANSAGSFSYTVANTNGQRSAPALVSITVLPANDVLTIGAAQFRTGTRRWDVTGTSTVNAPNLVTVTLVRTGQVIGTATPAAGAWSLRVLNSNVTAVNGDQVRATSTSGGSATLAVRVRQ